MTASLASGAIASTSLFVLLSGSAPMQCTHDADPSLRIEDTASDGLWDLAARFEKEGNHASAMEAWRYLADTYPSSRHADEARRLANGTSKFVPVAPADARDGGGR